MIEFEIFPTCPVPDIAFWLEKTSENLEKYLAHFGLKRKINLVAMHRGLGARVEETFSWTSAFEPYVGANIEVFDSFTNHSIILSFAVLSEEYPASLGSSTNLLWMLEDLEAGNQENGKIENLDQKLNQIKTEDQLFTFSINNPNPLMALATAIAAATFVELSNGIFHCENYMSDDIFPCEAELFWAALWADKDSSNVFWTHWAWRQIEALRAEN